MVSKFLIYRGLDLHQESFSWLPGAPKDMMLLQDVEVRMLISPKLLLNFFFLDV